MYNTVYISGAGRLTAIKDNSVQEQEVTNGRLQAYESIEGIEKMRAERTAQLDELRATADADPQKIAKLEEVIKYLDGALARSPVYQRMQKSRSAHTR